MPYDSVAAAMLKSHPKPYDSLIVDVADLGRNTYTLRFYRSNLSEFSDPQQVSIAEWAKEVLADMNKLDLHMVYDISGEEPPDVK